MKEEKKIKLVVAVRLCVGVLVGGLLCSCESSRPRVSGTAPTTAEALDEMLGR